MSNSAYKLNCEVSLCQNYLESQQRKLMSLMHLNSHALVYRPFSI